MSQYDSGKTERRYLPYRFFRPPDTLLPEHCQPFAMEVEIHQGEVRAQPVVVLGDAAVPRLLEAEHTLQDAEHMLDLGSYTGLSRVLPLGSLPSRPGEFHPQPLTEPCVNLSISVVPTSKVFSWHHLESSQVPYPSPD